MTTPSTEAAEALAAMRSSRAELAAAATCPPERHLAFAVLMGGLVAAQAAPTMFTLLIEAVILPCVGLVVAWDRKRTGMFINGYRAGRTRLVALGMLAVCIGGLAVGIWFKEERGIVWAPLACGVVVAVAAWFGSNLWQGVYRRELQETP